MHHKSIIKQTTCKVKAYEPGCSGNEYATIFPHGALFFEACFDPVKSNYAGNSILRFI
jgi:hypothetical protein